MTTKMSPAEIENHLAHFTGTEKWTKHWTGRILMTDGILAMADVCDAFWLTDVVASYQTPALREACNGFQVWTLKKDKEGNGAVVTCVRDTGEKPKVEQKIEYTDFPLDEIKLYVGETGEGHPPTLMLTSEY